MSYVTGTTHYNLPQTVGTDKRDWADTNQAFADIDAAIYGAVEDVATASTDISGLKDRMDTAEGNITQVQSDITGLDGRLTTAEQTIVAQGNEIGDVKSDTQDMICAYNEPTATSTHNYDVGDYFRYNDVLYRATQSITIGDTIVPDTNCTTTNVTTEILNIDDLSGDVTQLQTDVSDLSDSPNNKIIHKFIASTGTTVRALGVELSNIANLPDFTDPDVMYNCKLALVGSGISDGMYKLSRFSNNTLFFENTMQLWESGGNSVATYTDSIEINIVSHTCQAAKLYVKYIGPSGTASSEFVRDDLASASATSMTLFA